MCENFFKFNINRMKTLARITAIIAGVMGLIFIPLLGWMYWMVIPMG